MCGVRETNYRPLVVLSALQAEDNVSTSCLVHGTSASLLNEVSKSEQQWHDPECVLQMQDLRHHDKP